MTPFVNTVHHLPLQLRVEALEGVSATGGINGSGNAIQELDIALADVTVVNLISEGRLNGQGGGESQRTLCHLDHFLDTKWLRRHTPHEQMLQGVSSTPRFLL